MRCLFLVAAILFAGCGSDAAPPATNADLSTCTISAHQCVDPGCCDPVCQSAANGASCAPVGYTCKFFEGGCTCGGSGWSCSSPVPRDMATPRD